MVTQAVKDIKQSQESGFLGALMSMLAQVSMDPTIIDNASVNNTMSLLETIRGFASEYETLFSQDNFKENNVFCLSNLLRYATTIETTSRRLSTSQEMQQLANALVIKKNQFLDDMCKWTGLLGVEHRVIGGMELIVVIIESNSSTLQDFTFVRSTDGMITIVPIDEILQ